MGLDDSKKWSRINTWVSMWFPKPTYYPMTIAQLFLNIGTWLDQDASCPYWWIKVWWKRASSPRISKPWALTPRRQPKHWTRPSPHSGKHTNSTWPNSSNFIYQWTTQSTDPITLHHYEDIGHLNIFETHQEDRDGKAWLWICFGEEGHIEFNFPDRSRTKGKHNSKNKTNIVRLDKNHKKVSKDHRFKDHRFGRKKKKKKWELEAIERTNGPRRHDK